MDLSQYGDLFLSEAREHVSQINHQLLALEDAPDDRQSVEGVFRSVHTIKGMAATLGFESVTSLAHELENVLDRVRSETIAIDGSLLDLLFSAVDALETHVEAAIDEDRAEPAGTAALVARLQDASDGGRTVDRTGDDARPGSVAATRESGPEIDDVGDIDLGAGAKVDIEISSTSALPGVRAFMALQRARALGDVSDVEPAEEEIQSDAFSGRIRFVLSSERPIGEVRSALLAVGDVETVRFLSGDATVAFASVLTELDEVESTDAGDRSRSGRVRSIRVDLQRLDALTNQVGELVILRDRLRSVAERRDLDAIDQTMEEASRLISEIQAEVMNARMVPVWQVLDRFPRLVRDAAKSLGKKVRLEMSGREIEFDRSMLDEIGDPLMHLIRNAIDHGIEPAEVRRARGKSDTGQLRIDVSREHSRAVVCVRDDGGGIDRDRVLAAAVRRNLITEQAGHGLSDEEVYRFLTVPGFSTAEEVTNVSGRGVGLDVVATRVRALGGTLSIQSRVGDGSTFTIRLPLTLAIVRALLVSVGEQVYALPISHVRETDEIDPGRIRQLSGREVAVVRDEPLPLVRLDQLLGVNGVRTEETAAIVVVEVGEQRAGVLVDEMLGQREIVVKHFDATTGTSKLFSGATILADGRPALILDAGGLASGYVADASSG